MYRLELDTQRRIVVLVISGTQDGWEAKLMKIEWQNLQGTVNADWSLIIDLKSYNRAQGEAIKEQKKFAPVLAGTQFKNGLLLMPQSSVDPSPIISGLKLKPAGTFDEAWKLCGGEDRTVRLAPPRDGTRYTANNRPSQLQ